MQSLKGIPSLTTTVMTSKPDWKSLSVTQFEQRYHQCAESFPTPLPSASECRCQPATEHCFCSPADAHLCALVLTSSNSTHSEVVLCLSSTVRFICTKTTASTHFISFDVTWRKSSWDKTGHEKHKFSAFYCKSIH